MIRFAALLAWGATAACAGGSEVVFEGDIPTTPAPVPSAVSSVVSETTENTAPPAAALDSSAGETVPAGQPPATEAPAPDAPAAPPLILSEVPLDAIPGRIVVNGPLSDSVYVLGPDPDPLILYRERGGFASQPTWSPDGGRVAWSQSAGAAPSVAVRSLTDDEQSEYPSPFTPFYIQWRPDGRALALLGAAPGGTGLAVLDLERGEAVFKNSAASFYLQWSPGNGDRMITHLDESRLELLDASANDSTPVAATPGGFLSAVWTGDGRSVAYVRAPDPSDADRPRRLTLRNMESGAEETLAEGDGFFDFDFSPDGRRLAYSVRTLDGASQMFLLNLEDGPGASGPAERVPAPGVFAWQWSPDSRKILLLGLDGGLLSRQVYQAGEIVSYQSIVPTENFLRNYLLFWGQYRLSLEMWSPDSSAFVFTASDQGEDRVFLQRLEDEFPVLLAPGSMAAFSPAADLPAPPTGRADVAAG